MKPPNTLMTVPTSRREADPAVRHAERLYLAAVEKRWAGWLALPDDRLEAWQVRVKHNRQRRLSSSESQNAR